MKRGLPIFPIMDSLLITLMREINSVPLMYCPSTFTVGLRATSPYEYYMCARVRKDVKPDGVVWRAPPQTRVSTGGSQETEKSVLKSVVWTKKIVDEK